MAMWEAQPTEGRTPVRDLRNHHVDLCGLDYKRLGQVAHRVLAAIRNEHYQTVSRRTAINILSDAISQNRLDIRSERKSTKRFKVIFCLQAILATLNRLSPVGWRLW